MKIVFFGYMACYLGRQIKWNTEQHHLIFLNEMTSDDEIKAHCEKSDILVSMIFDHRFVSRCLKRILVPGIGVEKIDFSQVPEDVQVLTCAAHEMAVTEYILSYVITYFRELKRISDNFKFRNDWRDCSRSGGVARKQLNELTVGVIGGGRIGRKVVAMFALFGSMCRCLTRYPFDTTGSVAFFPRHERKAFLNGCDVVIVACGVDEQTRKIIDSDALGVMAPHTLFMNVARSECVDYDALANACYEKRIGLAVIDVWPFYPVGANQDVSPAEQDFSQLDNVVMTPHISAWTRTVIADRAATLARYVHEAAHVLQENPE